MAATCSLASPRPVKRARTRLGDPELFPDTQYARAPRGTAGISPAPAATAPSNPKLRVIDLFAGVGGLTLGAARAGFDVVLAVEKDPHAFKAHKLNFPKTVHSDADITDLDGPALLAAASLKSGELDGLIGGPPCQGFSSMGPRQAADTRNSLFVKFFELVVQTLPGFFVAENVRGILEPQYKEIREGALDLVRGKYVLLPPMRIKACDYGAPTTRERVFFVGYRKGALSSLDVTDFESRKVETKTLVRDALFGLPAVRSAWLEEPQGWRRAYSPQESDYSKSITGNIPEGVGSEDALKKYREKNLVSGCLGTIHTTPLRERYNAMKPGEKDQISKAVRLDPNGFCPTLRAGTAADKGSYQAVRPIHPTMPRVITPREAARMQGFPDWFQFAPSKWHSFRQIGNSVSPFVAEAVLTVIFNKMSLLPDATQSKTTSR